MAISPPLPRGASRCVLLVIEEHALSELLAEALVEAGHLVVQAADAAAARTAADAELFDAAIVDLDTRARDGLGLVVQLRTQQPTLTVIALLPCGGLPGSTTPPPYQLALEKPARLAALLSAVHVAPVAMRN